MSEFGRKVADMIREEHERVRPSRTLVLKPGDTIILRYDGHLTAEQAESVNSAVESKGVKAIVLDSRWTVAQG